MPDQSSPEDDLLLAEQVAYYRARAGEYDEWWRREGRYDHGAEAKRRWQDEVAVVERALEEFAPRGDVLELACGTGWWTRRLAEYAQTLTCVDASREVIAINRARLAAAGHQSQRYLEADLFGWRAGRRYDVVFFSFWLSHVPPERFEGFWSMVAEALKPHGRVFLIDSWRETTSGAGDPRRPDEAGLQERRLNDGQTFRIIKLFYEPDVLAARLRRSGWRAELHRTEHYFIYGSAAIR
ncbi:MAG: class I SAM-dependent methyltransferase [Acetobacteraceae bacterium]